MNIKFKRFDESISLPTQAEGAACLDFYCREGATLKPGEIKLVPQNFALQVPKGYALLLFSRSSTPLKKGLMLANGVGVLDPFYRGDKDELLAMFLNITKKDVVIEKGDRLVQGMIIKTQNVKWDEVKNFYEDGHGGYQHH